MIPVPAGLSREELSLRRTEFLVSSGWREPRDLREEFLRRHRDRQFMLKLGWWSPDDVRDRFLRRDRALQTAADHDEVVPWFGHNLNDQLQLIQS